MIPTWAPLLYSCCSIAVNSIAVTLQCCFRSTATLLAVEIDYGIVQAFQSGCVTYSSKSGAGRPAWVKIELIRSCSLGDMRYSPFWA